MLYKGYRIEVVWNHAKSKFNSYVYEMNGLEVFKSGLQGWQSAMSAAKDYINE